MNVEECYRAIVTDVQDPEKRGRIKVTSADLLGDADAALPMWLEPAMNWGWFITPDVGEIVEVVINGHGDMDESFSQQSLEALDPRWRGTRMWTADDAETARTVPEDFTAQNYGKRRGFATPNGHVLMFDDTEGKEKISLTWKGKADGADAFSFLAMDEDGSMIQSNRNGSLIYLNAKAGELTVVDEHGNSLKMAEAGISLVDKFANVIEMKDGVIQIISQDAIVATGKDFTAATGTVNLVDGADTFLVRGADLVTWLTSHTHPTGMGPSGPPVVPPPPTVLSTAAKVK